MATRAQFLKKYADKRIGTGKTLACKRIAVKEAPSALVQIEEAFCGALAREYLTLSRS
jgi:hypothetical protein